jgi:Fic family protein
MPTYNEVVSFWQNKRASGEATIEQHLDSFRVLFAYHSGKIENDEVNYHDTREIFENGKVQNYTGSPRALFEQQNQKLCYDFLKDKIENREPLTLQLIKEIHLTLTAGTFDERRFIENGERPGEFKKHDYVTGVLEVGAAAEDVEMELQDLLEEVNNYQGNNRLTAAAYLHARFENIHPFADGNGRVGRTLVNYYLMIHNSPPLIVYEEDKKIYFECLQRFDEEEELEPLTRFLAYETEKTWTKAWELEQRQQAQHRSLEEHMIDR